MSKKATLSALFRLMRLDKPVGIWLLLWPCWWATALASEGLPDLWYLVWFALGAVVMRSAGCVVNDLADRRIDRQVTRTRTRPLASGALRPWHACAVLAGLLLLGLAVLLQFNAFTIALGIASLPLVAAYPFMKRITWWPQAFLGLTFNWGALMGFAAVTGGLPPAAWALYAGCLFWTLGYDTIYAHQDKEDDARIGVKSTALRLGSRTRPMVMACYGLTVGCLLLAGQWAGAGLPYTLAVCVMAVHLGWQVRTVQLDTPESALRRFQSNIYIGAVVFIGALADGLLAFAEF